MLLLRKMGDRATDAPCLVGESGTALEDAPSRLKGACGLGLAGLRLVSRKIGLQMKK